MFVVNAKVAALTGLLIGGAVGFLSGMKYSKKKYETLLEIETSRAREMFVKKAKDLEKKYQESMKRETCSVDINSHEVPNTTEMKGVETSEAVVDEAYRIMVDNGYLVDDEPELPEYDQEIMGLVDEDSDISIIPEAWLNNRVSDNPDYDVVELVYFPDDDAFLDELDEPLETPENVIGEEACDEISKDNRNILYVRNDLNETYFVIKKVLGSMVEYLHGPYSRVPKGRKMRESDGEWDG